MSLPRRSFGLYIENKKNPFRRFVRCKKDKQNGGCSMFRWIDDACVQLEFVKYIDEINVLETKLQMAEDESIEMAAKHAEHVAQIEESWRKLVAIEKEEVEKCRLQLKRKDMIITMMCIIIVCLNTQISMFR
ncbi:hypothetical protein Dimus_009094 [Dionaea muscipula]